MNIHDMSTILNENAQAIRTRLSNSREEAMKFLKVCEAEGFRVEVKDNRTGMVVELCDLPDAIVQASALQMFDSVRKRMMH